MKYVKRGGFFLGIAVLACLAWQAPAHATTLFSIDINRTSADPEALTFSGSGLIHFDSPANSVADVDVFSLELETIGGTSSDLDLMVLRQFVFGLADIVSVTGLVAGPMLSGVIELAPGKLSEDGAVVLGGSGDTTVLDFTAGTASGFCFGAAGGEQCIFGGGSSSAIDAELSSRIVPLPWTAPLLIAALGALALRPRATQPIAPA